MVGSFSSIRKTSGLITGTLQTECSGAPWEVVAADQKIKAVSLRPTWEHETLGTEVGREAKGNREREEGQGRMERE